MIKTNFEKPKSVRLEASTICQLKCECCYMRFSENTVGINYLKFEDFAKFVTQNDFVKEIELSNSGEIFLNPDLLKIMKFAHEKGVELTAYNGVNLNNVEDEVLEGLVKYGFKKMTCSIDGASQETYSKYRIGGNFDTVISNIKKINEYKKKYNSTYPKIKYQFIIFGHNEHEIPQAKILAKELDTEINFKFNWNKDYSPIKNPEFIKKETGLKVTSLGDGVKKENNNYIRNICIKMWTQPQINWDGRLLGCCMLYQQDFEVNVFEIGLENALKSEKFNYAKQMLMNKVPEKADMPCLHCHLYASIKQTNSHITEDELLTYC